MFCLTFTPQVTISDIFNSAMTDLTSELRLLRAENEDIKKQNSQLKAERNLETVKISVELTKLRNNLIEIFVLVSRQKDDLDKLLGYVKHDEENNCLIEPNKEPLATSTPRKHYIMKKHTERSNTDVVKFVLRTDLLNAAGEDIEDIQM